MKKYFAKYLPIEGEIKEGIIVIMRAGDRDHVGDRYIVKDIQPDGKCEMHCGMELHYANIDDIGKDKDYYQVKLFLCSRDIQVGDDIQYPNGVKIQKNTMDKKDIDIMKLLPNGPFKVIGEILTPGIIENQEFTEKEIEFLTIGENIP